MATAAPQTDPENYDLECAVCTEILRDARLLRCGHHFCRVCLEQIADRHPQGAVPCPTCRHVTDIQEEVGVDRLPKYAATSEFSRRVTDALKGRGNVQPTKCDVCKESSSEMYMYCIACAKIFCDSCMSKHGKLEKILIHKLYPVSHFMYCSSHEQTFVQLHCKTCSTLICPSCALEVHANHEFEDIQVTSEEIRSRLRNTRDNMDAAEKETEAAPRLKQTLETAVEIQKTFQTSIAGLKQALKDMLAKVETLEQEVLEKLEANIKLLKGMDTDMNDYMGSKLKLRDHITYLIEAASDSEVVGGEDELPGYDKDTYRHGITTADIELPALDTTLTDLQTQLDNMVQQLEVGYTTYQLCNEDTYNDNCEDNIDIEENMYDPFDNYGDIEQNEYDDYYDDYEHYEQELYRFKSKKKAPSHRFSQIKKKEKKKAPAPFSTGKK